MVASKPGTCCLASDVGACLQTQLKVRPALAIWALVYGRVTVSLWANFPSCHTHKTRIASGSAEGEIAACAGSSLHLPHSSLAA